MPVVTYPKNSCDSRAPLGLPRPCGGSMPAPHISPLRPRRKNGRRRTTPRAGGVQRPCRGRIARSPGWRITAKNGNPSTIPVPTHVLLYIPARHRTKLCTIPVPTHVLLCDLYWNCCTCTAVYVCRYSAGGERGKARGKNRHTVPVLGWFGVPLLFLFYFICVRYTVPVSGCTNAYDSVPLETSTSINQLSLIHI